MRDPLIVCRELSRVARRGYIEVPSRLREIFSKAWAFHLRAGLGRMPEVGFYHHRWFVDLVPPNGLIFRRKTHEAAMDRDFYITRWELRGKLDEEESGQCLWWESHLSAREAFDLDRDELRDFKRRSLANHRRPLRNILPWPAGSIRRD